MNASNAKDYLPLVQALAEGKTIQRFSNGDGWEDVRSPSFENPAKLYRIKPEPKKGWHRVALLNFEGAGVKAVIADTEALESAIAESTSFIEWLTDRIEYELPQGDA